MNQPNLPSNASNSNIHLDPNEVKHLYANAVSVAPSVDECIIDLGVSSVVMPPEFQGKPMTPEMATQVKVMFRHESRVYMNWAAAKRFSRIIAGAVQAHEATFGEISLLEEREDLAAKAAAMSNAGTSPTA